MRPLITIIATLLCASCATPGARTTVPPDASTPERSPAAQNSPDLVTGKRVYDLHCARCHGADGKDKTYPFIATLDGIGKRMSPIEILKATWATGFVSERQFLEEEKHDLAVYVATL